MIVRLVTAPSATVKAHYSPKKVGHGGAKTALLLHYFVDGGGVKPEVVVVVPVTAILAMVVVRDGRRPGKRSVRKSLQPPLPPPPLGRSLACGSRPHRAASAAADRRRTCSGTQRQQRHVTTAQTSHATRLQAGVVEALGQTRSRRRRTAETGAVTGAERTERRAKPPSSDKETGDRDPAAVIDGGLIDFFF